MPASNSMTPSFNDDPEAGISLRSSDNLNFHVHTPYTPSRLETMPTSSPVTVANSPFDDPEADIVLRSSNNIDFYVHRILLSLASPVFKSMFALPQSSLGEDGDGTGFKSVNGRYLPVIPLAENGEVLGRLLTWCDPRCIPTSTAPLDIDIVLRIADKYDMDTVANRVRKTLKLESESRLYTTPESLSMYAIACTHGFEDIARAAARGVLRQSMEHIPSVPELRNISGTALHNLYSYHFACSRAISSIRHWTPDDTDLVSLMTGCVSRPCNCEPQTLIPSKLGFPLKDWGITYVECAIAAISERPCGETILTQSSFWVQRSSHNSDPCPKCQPIAPLVLERFGKALAAEVDRIIDTVRDLLIYSVIASDSPLILFVRFPCCSMPNSFPISSPNLHLDLNRRIPLNRINVFVIIQITFLKPRLRFD